MALFNKENNEQKGAADLTGASDLRGTSKPEFLDDARDASETSTPSNMSNHTPDNSMPSGATSPEELFAPADGKRVVASNSANDHLSAIPEDEAQQGRRRKRKRAPGPRRFGVELPVDPNDQPPVKRPAVPVAEVLARRGRQGGYTAGPGGPDVRLIDNPYPQRVVAPATPQPHGSVPQQSPLSLSLIHI